MSKPLKYRQNGFTLTEIVISLAITSLVIIGILNFAAISIVQYSVASARAQVLSEAQSALDVVNNDIRLSASADDQNRWEDQYAPGAPANEYSWESDNDTLVLARVVEDDDGDIIFSDPAQYISHKNNVIYFLQNGTLYRRILADPVNGNSVSSTCPAGQASSSCPADRVILRNVRSLTFSYRNGEDVVVQPVDARSVEISVRVGQRRYGRDIDVTYSTRTVFRND